jgi:hypothetical protein
MAPAEIRVANEVGDRVGAVVCGERKAGTGRQGKHHRACDPPRKCCCFEFIKQDCRLQFLILSRLM